MTKKIAFFFSLIFFSIAANNCFGDVGLIRDSQSEKFLRELSRPIFLSANLTPENIKIYIINDNSINAFVSGGQNIFINTGLIRKYSTPDALIGVIAHESGHIAAGHLARSGEGAEQAQGAMLLSYLLGIGAVLGGSPDAGAAIMMGGSSTANRLFMKYTRGQEEAADQHAIRYLAEMQYPATGLVKLLEFFQSEMVGYQGEIDEYLLSHPVSKKRIDLIKARTANVNFSDTKINHSLQPQMDWVLSKLEGFMENPGEILEKYKNRRDQFSNYKKAIAFFRIGKSAEALKLMDPIIEKNRSDGFLFEQKGQILFESGQVSESVLAYNQAIKLLSEQDGAQAKIAFAAAILALSQNDRELTELALKRLIEAEKYEDENPFLFKQLASGYSKIDDEGRSFLALAEYNLLIGQKEKCTKYAKSAKDKLDKSAKAELLRADDLIELAKSDKKDAS